MALPQPKTFKQDMPPAGGFQKPVGFPSTGFRKISPTRGPSGYLIVAGTVGVVVFGMMRYFSDVQERNYYNLSRFNEKFERAYVKQAQEDVRWTHRQKELLNKERHLMRDVPGWVVGQRRYYTSWEDRPDIDVIDSRKSGPW